MTGSWQRQHFDVDAQQMDDVMCPIFSDTENECVKEKNPRGSQSSPHQSCSMWQAQ